MTRRILHTTLTSPYGRQVRIVLAEKALDHEIDQAVTLDRDPAAFGRISPGLRVPVLEDNGRTFFETRIILDYLLAAYPDQGPTGNPPLAVMATRPPHHFDDAMVLAALYGLLDVAINVLNFRRDGITAEQAPYLARHEERVASTLDWLEERCNVEGFQPGTFSLADIALICTVDFGTHRDLFALGERPSLRAVVERHAERLSVTSTSPF